MKYHMHLKESRFPDCWKVSSLVPVFKNVGERSMAKNYRPVGLPFVGVKVFEIGVLITPKMWPFV